MLGGGGGGRGACKRISEWNAAYRARIAHHVGGKKRAVPHSQQIGKFLQPRIRPYMG
jgi:hypothetical protein